MSIFGCTPRGAVAEITRGEVYFEIGPAIQNGVHVFLRVDVDFGLHEPWDALDLVRSKKGTRK